MYDRQRPRSRSRDHAYRPIREYYGPQNRIMSPPSPRRRNELSYNSRYERYGHYEPQSCVTARHDDQGFYADYQARPPRVRPPVSPIPRYASPPMYDDGERAYGLRNREEPHRLYERRPRSPYEPRYDSRYEPRYDSRYEHRHGSHNGPHFQSRLEPHPGYSHDRRPELHHEPRYNPRYEAAGNAPPRRESFRYEDEHQYGSDYQPPTYYESREGRDDAQGHRGRISIRGSDSRINSGWHRSRSSSGGHRSRFSSGGLDGRNHSGGRDGRTELHMVEEVEVHRPSDRDVFAPMPLRVSLSIDPSQALCDDLASAAPRCTQHTPAAFLNAASVLTLPSGRADNYRATLARLCAIDFPPTRRRIVPRSWEVSCAGDPVHPKELGPEGGFFPGLCKLKFEQRGGCPDEHYGCSLRHTWLTEEELVHILSNRDPAKVERAKDGLHRALEYWYVNYDAGRFNLNYPWR